jgi:hypothetical protein
MQNAGSFSVVKEGKTVLEFESSTVAENVAESLNGRRRRSIYDYDECDEVADSISGA